MRAVLGVLTAVALAFGQDAAPSQIRDAATRALALVQKSQKDWYRSQRCYSCHHQLQPALAYRAAREHGIPFDENIAHADAVRAFDYTDLDRAIQYSDVIEPAMNDAYRLVAADAAGVRGNLSTAIYARLIAQRQRPSGEWTSNHQRPPSSFSPFTKTALTLRAIQLYSHPSQLEDVKSRVELGRHFLLSNQARNTEDRTFQLLGLLWTDAERSAIQRAAQALVGAQLPDGGWNSLDGRASDAYSTGEALVALHDAAGVSLSNPAWRRGIEFLLKTQAADGSWHVASRLHPPAPVSPEYFDSGYPYGHDQFLSMTGASWDIMALARALGPARDVAPPELNEAAPRDVPPWVETILFGSVVDLQKLLDGGFNPNSATKTGHTTVLMMAAPDVEKVKLLLDRGADVNVRAESGYSALMVAAQYPKASDSMRLMLARGATVRVPGLRPQFNAYPMFLAAYAGDTEILKDLRDAGDQLNDTMALTGSVQQKPLLGAVQLGHADVVKALLDLGANVNAGVRANLTALDRAVLANYVDIARMLIQRGADVNHVDDVGMTPLLYAASIDYGDPAMIDLLIKSGARPNARTREGLTALDLARKYHLDRAAARLEASRSQAAK